MLTKTRKCTTGVCAWLIKLNTIYLADSAVSVTSLVYVAGLAVEEETVRKRIYA